MFKIMWQHIESHILNIANIRITRQYLPYTLEDWAWSFFAMLKQIIGSTSENV